WKRMGAGRGFASGGWGAVPLPLPVRCRFDRPPALSPGGGFPGILVAMAFASGRNGASVGVGVVAAVAHRRVFFFVFPLLSRVLFPFWGPGWGGVGVLFSVFCAGGVVSFLCHLGVSDHLCTMLIIAIL
ncbi:uncharacterized protein TM35_000074270, partial [Trypanosoma theileri]